MSETNYYQRNQEVILNRAKECYRNNRHELKVKARDKYRELSGEEKNIKIEYGKNRYNNMSEEDKQRLKEYQGNYRFQKDKKPISINKVDTKNIVLSNKIPYGEHGANKYYIAYLRGGFKPLHIIIKDIKLYTKHMNDLANDNELLKHIEISNKIEALFNKKSNKQGFHSKLTYNNEYIKTKLSPYNEDFHGNKRLIKDKYFGHSILLLESISEVENKYYHY